MRRATVAAALAVVAGLVCAACGGSTPLSQLSATQILARVATDVARQADDPVVEVVVATPSTTLTQMEDHDGNVSGKMVTPEGTFDAVREAQNGVLSLSYSARFIELTAPASVRDDGAALRIAASAMSGRWLSGAATDVDPSAEQFATHAFVDSPLTDEQGLFGALAGAKFTVGPVQSFDHTTVVPLTLSGNTERLFVSDTSEPLPVGASVLLGGDTSPTIFTFEWESPSNLRNPIYTTPMSVSPCSLWTRAAGVRPLLRSLAAPGAYAGC